MKIHKTKEQARAVLEEYNRRVLELQSELGVWEDTDDTCVSVYSYTQYYDQDGNCKKECY